MEEKLEKKPRILVVEDEDDIRNLIVYYLKNEGYEVIAVEDGDMGLQKLRAEEPVLLVLDLMLPGLDGRDLCRIARSDVRTRDVKILMLTARSTEDDIVEGLEIGADDYMTKPFSSKVLLARIRKLLGEVSEKSSKDRSLSFQGLELNYEKRLVKIDGNNIDLTYTEFEMLFLFLSHPGRVYSRFEIVNSIKGENYIVTDRTIDFQMVGLRKKIGQYAKSLKTVRGAGYKFQAEE